MILETIFTKTVKQDDGCWIYQGAPNNSGYAFVTLGSRTDGTRRRISVHRAVMILMGTEVDESLDVDHLCKVRLCVRPSHLRVLSRKENRGINREKTHCRNGHPYNDENTYTNGGKRFCRPCGAERAARYREKLL